MKGIGLLGAALLAALALSGIASATASAATVKTACRVAEATTAGKLGGNFEQCNEGFTRSEEAALGFLVLYNELAAITIKRIALQVLYCVEADTSKALLPYENSECTKETKPVDTGRFTKVSIGKGPCGEFAGAGSSLQNVAQTAVWIESTSTLKESFGPNGERWQNSICAHHPTVKYFSTSSGKGKAQWGANEAVDLLTETGVTKFPAFIGSDVAPEGPATTATTQLGEMDKAGSQGTALGEGVVAVPVAQSAVAVLVSLPASCFSAAGAPDPEVTSEHLEREWFANTVKAETLVTNASVKPNACEVLPALYARNSASGTTAGFKRYLGHLNSPDTVKWAEDINTAEHSESTSAWPTKPTEELGEEGGTVKFEKGSTLAEQVYLHPNTVKGAIGYADLADAKNANFTETVKEHYTLSVKIDSFYVLVQNNSYGNASPVYAGPEEGSGGGVNCSGAAYTTPAEVKGNEDWSGASQNNIEKEGTKNYPICTLTFDLAWHKYSSVKGSGTHTEKYIEEEAIGTYAYLHYIVNEGQGPELKAKHFGSLPTAIDEKAIEGLETEPMEANSNIQY